MISDFEIASGRWDYVYLGAVFIIVMTMFLCNPETFMAAIASMQLVD